MYAWEKKDFFYFIKGVCMCKGKTNTCLCLYQIKTSMKLKFITDMVRADEITKRAEAFEHNY